MFPCTQYNFDICNNVKFVCVLSEYARNTCLLVKHVYTCTVRYGCSSPYVFNEQVQSCMVRREHYNMVLAVSVREKCFNSVAKISVNKPMGV